MIDKDDKGFLLIKNTYKVRCKNCGYRGDAVLGKEPILESDAGLYDICPVCNHYSMAADAEKNR